MQKGDLVGRIVGMLVFLAGVGILVFVFVAAYQYFDSNTILLKPTTPVSATSSTTSRLGESALLLFGRIGLLVVMAIAGSQVASRGIQLYFAATGLRRSTPPALPESD
ncbi:MAG: hypothetical protein ABFD49_04550 [Armatimonadota bacterium]|nr:hypothetical protein [bacterium]